MGAVGAVRKMFICTIVAYGGKRMTYPYIHLIENIVYCMEYPFSGVHYAITAGKKHRIVSPTFYSYKNIDMLMAHEISAYDMAQYALAQPIYGMEPERIESAQGVVEARSFLLQEYSGTGLEFGAADAPLPFPLCCMINYADLFGTNEGVNFQRKGEFVPVKYKTSVNEMEGIPDNHFDLLQEHMS